MTWVLRDSVIDPLDLDDEVKDQAVAIAGESSVALTTDREFILLAAAGQIERYYRQRCGFAGLRVRRERATSIVETDTDRGDVPAVGALPSSVGVTITSVELWSDNCRECGRRLTYIRRPLSAWSA